MSDGLSDADRAWMETRFQAILGKQEQQDVTIGDLKLKVLTLELGSPHKCTEEIKRHENSSWAHSPYKAGGLLVAIFGIVESAKKIFFSGH